jgi:hypothetical protein
MSIPTQPRDWSKRVIVELGVWIWMIVGVYSFNGHQRALHLTGGMTDELGWLGFRLAFSHNDSSFVVVVRPAGVRHHLDWPLCLRSLLGAQSTWRISFSRLFVVRCELNSRAGSDCFISSPTPIPKTLLRPWRDGPPQIIFRGPTRQNANRAKSGAGLLELENLLRGNFLDPQRY